MRLACASSDENVSVLTHHGEGRWSATMFKAHKTGCNALSWAPVDASGTLRLATGGCDNLVRVWASSDGGETWRESAVLPPLHTDWVRDVAWAPAVGGDGGAVIASCAQDRKVAIWTEAHGQWVPKVSEAERSLANASEALRRSPRSDISPHRLARLLSGHRASVGSLVRLVVHHRRHPRCGRRRQPGETTCTSLPIFPWP